MDIQVDTLPWLLSSIYSDLHQTARFTARGQEELNPLAKPIVQPKTALGEIALGVAGTAIAPHIPKWLQALWAAGHTAAVVHNAKATGEKIPGIMFPAVTIRGDFDTMLENRFKALRDMIRHKEQ